MNKRAEILLRVLAEYFLHLSTVEKLCERFSITLSQLRRWLQLFRVQKEEWLGVLSSMEASGLSFLKALLMQTAYSDFRHWKTPRTLFECLDIPEEIEPYVNDYRMNLYEIAYLSDEQQMFTSDLKIVADYFVQMRKNRSYVASEVTIKHVHELLQLMAVMTQDNRFEQVYSPDMERRPMTMCEVLDQVENRGIQKGIIQGEDTILSLMNYLLSNNRAEDAKKVTEDKAYRNKLLTEIFGRE